MQDHIDFPKFHREVELCSQGRGFYSIVYEYLCTTWSGDLELISNTTLATRRSQASFSGIVKSYTHVWLAKRRYGAGTSSRDCQLNMDILTGASQCLLTTFSRHLSPMPLAISWYRRTLLLGLSVLMQMEFPWAIWYDYMNLQSRSVSLIYLIQGPRI